MGRVLLPRATWCACLPWCAPSMTCCLAPSAPAAVLDRGDVWLPEAAGPESHGHGEERQADIHLLRLLLRAAHSPCSSCSAVSSPRCPRLCRSGRRAFGARAAGKMARTRSQRAVRAEWDGEGRRQASWGGLGGRHRRLPAACGWLRCAVLHMHQTAGPPPPLPSAACVHVPDMCRVGCRHRPGLHS